ncbi:hypothetical protein SBRY_50709 [Actinacidiphila bryophytorum]|uniref:Uncharacterized protein n=1 Tax=Actinacidiphila bryophytorum TaxID=1436133 RepID=A0A9W4H5D3_9ACTN|nr:hypothetical protein SBRY_50709 [Actinacidiphila bryophytorum]
MGPAAAGGLAGAGRAGGGRGAGRVPGGGVRRGRRLPADREAAGEAPRARGVERHRRRAAGRACRREGPGRHARPGVGQGPAQYQCEVRGPLDRADRGRCPALHRRPAGAAAHPGRGGRGGGGRAGRLPGHGRRGQAAAAGALRRARRRLPGGRHRQRGHQVVRGAAARPPRGAAGAPGEGGARVGAAAVRRQGRFPRGAGGARGPQGGARPEADAGGQRHPARLDRRRRAAVPGAAVQEPQGQCGPGDAAARAARRLRADDRRAAGQGARPQRRPAAAGRLLRQERGAGRGDGRLRGGLCRQDGGGPRRPAGRDTGGAAARGLRGPPHGGLTPAAARDARRAFVRPDGRPRDRPRSCLRRDHPDRP